MSNIVEVFYRDHTDLTRFLEEVRQPSHLSFAQDIFRRSLVLAIASYFENEISEILRQFARVRSNADLHVCALIEQKAITRQYHSLFDWEAKNANKFYSLFGSEFSQYAKDQVAKEPLLAGAARAFLQLGNMRNLLVHNNFIKFTVERTPAELFEMYETAVGFVTFVRQALLDPVGSSS